MTVVSKRVAGPGWTLFLGKGALHLMAPKFRVFMYISEPILFVFIFLVILDFIVLRYRYAAVISNRPIYEPNKGASRNNVYMLVGIQYRHLQGI